MNKLKQFWLNQKPFFTPFVVLLLLIMFIVEFVKGAILVSILPIYMKSVLGISTFVIGWTMALQYLGDNLFRSPVGWLIDKVGYRAVMLTGVLLTFASVVIMVTFSHTFWIIVACTLLGIGTSPLWPCVITGATESVGEQATGTTMSIIYLSWLSGVGLGPVVINFFIGETYTGAFRLLVLLTAVCVAVTFFLPSRRRDEANMKTVLHELKDKRARQQPQESLWTRQARKIRQYMGEVSRSLNVSWAFYPALFAQTFALGLLTPVLTLYARTVLNLTPSQYSMFLIAGGAITVLFLIPVGKLVDRWGTRWFINIGLLLSSFTLLTFTFVSSIYFVLALVTLLGIGYALIIPSWNALIASVIPKEKRGAIWGFFLTIEGSGNVIGPIISGKLWDSFGHQAPFVTSGLVLAALFVLQLFIFVNRKVMVR
ncbi:MFS transporter [Paenibacillus hemerocallicola]|uniref:MFS transporter n=1 Tax=Paenibacillus hemerocallicola TaxID=1172614 RepID=A0A5C4TEY3_9BACL|nr:MFS transporter [Paenibacillus hemerocallicola]TNJ67107.1 MFS transporter [Paenibacillus hemerocallicola]